MKDKDKKRIAKMPPKKQRTIQQNRALHLLFTQLADCLNEQGLTMTKVLKPHVDVPWTARSIKEYMWRSVQEALLAKKSTTQLETQEVDQVFDVIYKHLHEQFPGINLPPFPSIETMMRALEEPPPPTKFDRDATPEEQQEFLDQEGVESIPL